MCDEEDSVGAPLGYVSGRIKNRGIYAGGKTEEELECDGVAWRNACRDLSLPSVAVEITGSKGSFAEWTNGLYIGQPTEKDEDSPTFRRIGGKYDRHLYWANDGRWRVGGIENMQKREPAFGSLHSAVVKAGTLPWDAESWELRTGYNEWASQGDLLVKKREKGKPALEAEKKD
eukprot:gnl/TRDRNA2_/TRDRNA2_151730_c0_seq1.p1 gnl/TRDRNA2_/TRDRNA2_151730_c0~~gnl/TRDRNA2_/TRDRNA2_151730_c0_seq1.p1  ORF type:complete len:174 (+),score=33.55 gnl/TRDRNA2_/TRDRNA2_151730_c0_seq1:86-607(+)